MEKLFTLLSIILLTFLACAQKTESEVEVENPETLNYTTTLIVPDLKRGFKN